eukprot:2720990-Pleurochrysis_carterae.AAC.4
MGCSESYVARVLNTGARGACECGANRADTKCHSQFSAYATPPERCDVPADASCPPQIGNLLDHNQIDPYGPRRKEQRAEMTIEVEQTIHEFRYHANVQKLGAKFDEELRRLLAELRKQVRERPPIGL